LPGPPQADRVRSAAEIRKPDRTAAGDNARRAAPPPRRGSDAEEVPNVQSEEHQRLARCRRRGSRVVRRRRRDGASASGAHRRLWRPHGPLAVRSAATGLTAGQPLASGRDSSKGTNSRLLCISRTVTGLRTPSGADPASVHHPFLSRRRDTRDATARATRDHLHRQSALPHG
jgi:hypothetical protein